jgi:uncharacterized protein (DUF736 family)
MSYDNMNRGVLFKNDKGQNEKRPDYRGTLNVAGEEWNISGWIRASQKTGDKFLSLSIEKKREQKQQKQDKPTQNAAAGEDFNDDIPF